MPEPRAQQLRRRLLDLSLNVRCAEVRRDAIKLPSYADEPRPTSTVTLTGDGKSGTGENVAWTTGDHLKFQKVVDGRAWAFGDTLGNFARRLQTMVPDPYQRSAIESAAIDLALRQAGTNLADLVSTDFQKIRYVRSFGATKHPLVELRAHHRQAPTVEVKLDVHPEWDSDTRSALAQLGTIAILDFKHRGSEKEQIRIATELSEPWLEDPGTAGQLPPKPLAGRFSLDAALSGEEPDRILRELQPVAANLKAPRMGGVLPLLQAAAFCESRKIPVYLGGMFEVSVGRMQARELASLLAPDGPNDLAPIPQQANYQFPRTLSVPRAGHGFGHR